MTSEKERLILNIGNLYNDTTWYNTHYDHGGDSEVIIFIQHHTGLKIDIEGTEHLIINIILTV